MSSEPNEPSAYRKLTDAAVNALREKNWEVEKEPGMTRQNVWRMTRNGESHLVSVRTTRNRWIAYNTMEKGKKWKTLDDVAYACIAAYTYNDEDEDPNGIEVHLIDADELRAHFDTGYRIRTKGGQKVTDDFGMWICMDQYDEDPLAGGGSGFANGKTLIASYPFGEEDEDDDEGAAAPASAPAALTVAQIVETARAEIARTTGVGVESISLELRMKM